MERCAVYIYVWKLEMKVMEVIALDCIYVYISSLFLRARLVMLSGRFDIVKRLSKQQSVDV